MVPAAGWLKREEYGDANIAFRRDSSLAHMDLLLEAMLPNLSPNPNPSLYRLGAYG